MKKNIAFTILILLLSFQFSLADSSSIKIDLNENINIKGTISFVLKTDKNYKNGLPENNYAQSLLELPGLASCILDKSQSGIFVAMQWQENSEHIGFYLLFSDLPGPESYHILFTWDSEKGISDGYFNGIPFRKENLRYHKPWKVEGNSEVIIIPDGLLKVSDVKVTNYYSSKKTARKLTPKNLRGQNEHLIGQIDLPKPVNLENRKGKLLYSRELNLKDDVKDWIFEGPGEYKFQDNSMILSSKIPNPPDFSTGHYNFWCPQDFPDKIVVEWEFKPMVDFGACHIYFAAQGKNGVDVFDESLPERDGHFNQYINGEINNYYIIYFSNIQSMRTTNMATIWLTKTSKQDMLALGKIGIEPGKRKFYKMKLIKDGSHIQLLIDGKVHLDYIDTDATRYGTVLTNGKISFRQMAVNIAAYKNFKVWELR